MLYFKYYTLKILPVEMVPLFDDTDPCRENVPELN